MAGRVDARDSSASGWRRTAGALARRRRHKNWDDHVAHVERLVERPAFRALRDRILALARLRADDRLLDVGAGTGLLALAAARRVARVSAVDISPAMCMHLERKLGQLQLGNVEALVGSATALPLGDASVDVVLSNYCFHHLSDRDKRRALSEIRRVLRPGGRLVFGDMMFSLGVVDRRDRAVLALMAKRMIRMGPAGVIRLLRNALRILARRWEHPASVDWWRAALHAHGFSEVSVRALDHEGGIACARRPA